MQLESIGHADVDSLDEAYDLLRLHANDDPWPSYAERLAHLKQLKVALLDSRDSLKRAMASDFRKAPEEVDLTEILPVLAEIKFARRHLKGWLRPKSVPTPLMLFGTTSRIRFDPKGVVLIISPWNYPVNLTLGPLVAALAAGNRVMLKPSEQTPATAEVLRKIVEDTFEPERVAIAVGDRSVSTRLLELPFDHIFFTGSTGVGKIVMEAAAKHLASVTLELGGKSPVIVDESADLDVAARRIVWGKFVNKGQTCIAPDFVLVHESVHDRLVDGMKAEVATQYGATADDQEAASHYARIVSTKHTQRLSGLLHDAMSRGAVVETGGTVTESTKYISPTILTGVPSDAKLMTEEIFGPILPVLPYRDLSEAVSVIRRTENPLALYIFSRDDITTQSLLDKAPAGGTCVNDIGLHFVNPALPFGGLKQSGIGKSHGYHGFAAFSNARPILRQRMTHAPLGQIYPPYTGKTRRLIDWLFRLY